MVTARPWFVPALALVLVLGTALRVFAFDVVPTGLNNHEASTGFDALALARLGTDRWGHPWPVYFPAWGSGMNALASYLVAPLILWLGLEPIALRLPALVHGLLSLPLVYVLGRALFDRPTALLAAALLAVLPWHVMASRWMLESNLLPFWVLLGLVTVARALDPDARPWWRYVALVPFAIGLYAYAFFLFVLPVFFAAILLAYRREIGANSRQWTVGAFVAGLVAAPLGLFILKNFVLHGPLPGEEALPFSLPLLPSHRVAQAHTSGLRTLLSHLRVLGSGFADPWPWNTSRDALPLGLVVPVFAAIGLAVLAVRPEPRRGARLPLFLVLAYLPPMLLFEAPLNRINGVLIVTPVLAATGLVHLFRDLGSVALKRASALAVAGLLVVQTVAFAGTYFRSYNREAGSDFRAGLEEALSVVTDVASADELVVIPDDGSLHIYLYVFYYGDATIEGFRERAVVRLTDNGSFEVSRVGRYVFAPALLAPGTAFVFVAPADDPPCEDPVLLHQGGPWQVGRCASGA